MALVSLSSGCAVTIKDSQWCSPIPGGLGAVCDNFLIANQVILTQAEWENAQRNWVNAGLAVECTTSNTLGDLKREIEKLCSLTPCDYPTKARILQGLTKLQTLGEVPPKPATSLDPDSKPSHN